MQPGIKESDWKLLRSLKPVALERFCERVLTEIGEVSTKQSQTFHQRYLAVYALVRERDKELGHAFDGMSRSKALFQIASMRALKLISSEEFAAFSAETQADIRLLCGEKGAVR